MDRLERPAREILLYSLGSLSQDLPETVCHNNVDARTQLSEKPGADICTQSQKRTLGKI